MIKRKTLSLLFAAVLGTGALVGIVSTASFMRVSNAVGAEAGAFSAPANVFTPTELAEEYVGVAVGDNGNSIQAKFVGVTKGDDGLLIAPGSYAYVTNVEPLRSVSSIALACDIPDNFESIFFFSSVPMDLDGIYSGRYSDLYFTVSDAVYNPSLGLFTCQLPAERSQSYRYVLGLLDAPETSGITVRSLSLTTPCAAQPEEAATGDYGDWSEEVKASMASILGTPLPGLGHNAYLYSGEKHALQFTYPSFEDLEDYLSSLEGEGYEQNYAEPIGDGQYGMIWQKRLPENGVASLIIMFAPRPSGFCRVSMELLDTFDWMGSDSEWPLDRLREQFGDDFAEALAPIDLESAEFTTMSEHGDYYDTSSILIKPVSQFTAEYLESYLAAMRGKGWDVEENRYGASDSYYAFTRPDHLNWAASLSLDEEQVVLNLQKTAMTDSFPIALLREKFGDQIPGFDATATYVFEAGDPFSTDIAFSCYGLSPSRALEYADALVGAGYVIISQNDDSVSLGDIASRSRVSMDFRENDCVAFDFNLLSYELMGADDFASLASTILDWNGFDPSRFDLSPFASLPGASRIQALRTARNTFQAVVEGAGQDYLDALLDLGTDDPLLGGVVLCDDGGDEKGENRSKFLLLSSSVGDGRCILELAALRPLMLIGYQEANQIIRWRVEERAPSFEPVLLPATEASLVFGKGIGFLDGDGDDALLSLRQALAADPRFGYSEIDDAYVALDEHFAYFFLHDDTFPAHTEVLINYYESAIPHAYVPIDDLPSNTKEFLTNFPALPDGIGACYLNSATPYSDETGTDLHLRVASSFPIKDYLASAVAEGYVKKGGRYTLAEGGSIHLISYEKRYDDLGHSYNDLSFSVYPTLGEGVLAARLGESLSSLLPSSLLNGTSFYCFEGDDGNFRWEAIEYDLDALANDMGEIGGWEVRTDTPMSKEFSRFDDATGNLISFTARQEESCIVFIIQATHYESDFVPTKLGYYYLGANPHVLETFMEAILPNDGDIAFSAEGYNLNLIVQGGDMDLYVEQLRERGLDIRESGDRRSAYGPGINYYLAPAGDGIYTVTVQAYYEMPAVLDNGEFASFASSQGFLGADPNFGDLCLSVRYINALDVGANEIYLALELDSGSIVAIRDTFLERGYALDPDSGTLLLQRDGYEYRVELEDYRLALAIIRL